MNSISIILLLLLRRWLLVLQILALLLLVAVGCSSSAAMLVAVEPGGEDGSFSSVSAISSSRHPPRRRGLSSSSTVNGRHSWDLHFEHAVYDDGDIDDEQPATFVLYYTHDDVSTATALLEGRILERTCSSTEGEDDAVVNSGGLILDGDDSIVVDETMVTCTIDIDWETLGSSNSNYYNRINATHSEISFCFCLGLIVDGHVMEYERTVISALLDLRSDILTPKNKNTAPSSRSSIGTIIDEDDQQDQEEVLLVTTAVQNNENLSFSLAPDLLVPRITAAIGSVFALMVMVAVLSDL